jgi:hypothetical protein
MTPTAHIFPAMTMLIGLLSGYCSSNKSIYDYGPQWPWVDNTTPNPSKVIDILTSRNGLGINQILISKVISISTKCFHQIKEV